MISTHLVEPDNASARFLLEMLQSEYVGLFGEPDPNPMTLDDAVPPDGGIILMVSAQGQPIGVGGWKHQDNGVAVLKRMYVHYAHRRQGLSKRLLHAIEYHARYCGMHRMILDTTTDSVAAIALYYGQGYEPIEPFGFYKDAPDSIFLGRDL